MNNQININEEQRSLLKFGWNLFFQNQLEDNPTDRLSPARVIGVYKNSFRVSDGQREWTATMAGKLRNNTEGLYPAAGDWVLVADQVISKVLKRKNVLVRGAAGTHERHSGITQKEQVIAANLDTVFIVCGLDRDFNIRRIERYLTLIYNCALTPVIVLTKADLHLDPDSFLLEVEAVAYGVPVVLVSADDDSGLKALGAYLAPGQTVTLLGSSGAGKSTLVNRLYGTDVQVTGAVSAQVGKGKHTTTSRDLILLPQGGVIIDNPGIREIGLWDGSQGMEAVFPEIEALGLKCRFVDCSHIHEPGCQVQAAVERGDIPAERLENYQKMKRELAYQAQRQNKSADRVEKERWKEVSLLVRRIKKEKF